MNRTQKVIIDCDPGCDDALALIYAYGSKALEILAVTTCSGNTDLETTSQNARAILNLIGASQIPVIKGAKKPLRYPLETSVVHGAKGLGNLKLKPAPTSICGAPKYICKTALTFPKKVSIIALGPLTNLAQAFQQDPSAFRKIKELVILGGNISAAGNRGPLADFNFYVDPHAAEIVLQSGVPIKLITLDACYSACLVSKDFKAVKNSKFRKVLKDLLDPYIQANWEEEGIRGAIMYDPLAVYCALNPKKVRGIKYRAVVETQGLYTRGMTVIDKRLRSTLKQNVTVIERVNLNDFKSNLFRAINQIELNTNPSLKAISS